MPMEIVRQLPYNHPYRWDGTLFGGPKLWRPDSLGASLTLWLDAEDASTITLNGSTVSQWNDKSGKGNNVYQSIAVSQPAYESISLNGKPGLRWSTTYKALLTGVNFVFDDFDVFVVYRSGTANRSYERIVDYNYFTGWFVGRNGTNANSWGGGVKQTVPPYGQYITLSDAAPHILELGRSNTLAAINGDGGAQTITATVSNTTTGNSPIAIGANANVAITFDFFEGGSIHEVIVLSSYLSVLNRNKMEGYLAWKWGLEANLPSNHPFKLLPPTV